MENIKNNLSVDPFFKNRIFKLKPIQNLNKNSKYLLEIDDQKYTLITDKHDIEKYDLRISKLGQHFKDICEFIYEDINHTFIILNYYNQGSGKTIKHFYDQNIFPTKDTILKLESLINHIHQPCPEFISVSTHFNNKNWYDFIKNYSQKYLEICLENNCISKQIYDDLIEFIENKKNYFLNVNMCYLHGDITDENVCFNEKDNKIYLIDFDDFLIGDPVYEFARLRQYSHIKTFKKLLTTYHGDLENNDIFWFYIIRNELMTISYGIHNNLNNSSSIKRLNQALYKLKKLTKEEK